MPNVSVHLPGEDGTVGLTIQLRNRDTGAVVNATPDSLTESVNATFFTADVEGSLTADAVYRVDVFDSGGDVLWNGWAVGNGDDDIVAYDSLSPVIASDHDAVDLSEDALTDIREILQSVTARVGTTLQADESLYLTIGDDYSVELGNQINWELSDASGIADMSTMTVKLFIKTGNTVTEFSDGTISVATGSTRSGYIEATRAETALMSSCEHARWHLKFYTDSGQEYVFETALVVGDAVIEPQIG